MCQNTNNFNQKLFRFSVVEFRYQSEFSDSTFSSCSLEDRYLCELALDGDVK